MDRLCLNALRGYISRVTDEKTSELFNWLHLKIIYKSLGIGDQKVDDQKKMNLVSQFQSTITDQVRSFYTIQYYSCGPINVH